MALIRDTGREPGGERVFEFGCDWPGCGAETVYAGEDAGEAEHMLKAHGAWGSRGTEGLYCEEHTPPAVERARRLSRHDVLPQPIRAGNLLAIALGNVEERYVFAAEENCIGGVPAAPLGERDVGFGRWTAVTEGVATFETGDGRKLLFTAQDVTAEHDRMVEEDRDTGGEGAGMGGEHVRGEEYDLSGGKRGKYAGRADEARAEPSEGEK